MLINNSYSKINTQFFRDDSIYTRLRVVPVHRGSCIFNRAASEADRKTKRIILLS